MAATLINSAFIERRHRLLAYAMALVLLSLIAIAFTLTSWNSVVERHKIEIETQTVMGAQAVDTYFVLMEKSLAELARKIQAQGLNAGTRGLLLEYKRGFPEFEIVVVTRPDGELFATTVPPRPGQNATIGNVGNIGKEPSFMSAREELLKGASMVVSRPFRGLVSGRWSAPLRYGVRDTEGRLQFILGGGLSLERTHDFWRDAPLPAGAGMGILRDDTYAVARYPRVAAITDDVLFANPAPGVIGEYLRNHDKPASGVIRSRSAVTGVDTIVSFKRLQHYPLTFFVAHPESELRATWWTFAWPTYALMLLLCGGGMAIIGWIGRRQAEWQAEREARLAALEQQTERQRASNAELQDLTTRLSISNAKLEATNAEIEAFMYTVSHDLRAPIRAIDGFSTLLQRSLQLDENGEDYKLFARVRANTRRMAHLLNDLLDLSRYSTQPLKKENIDVRAEVDAVIAELQAAGAHTAFEIGSLPGLNGDRILMRQVWINLITNAIKYSANQPAPVIRIGFENGAYVVADNGAGFDMAYAGKLFKLFSRLHHERDFEGTGIGLAIVKRIVERHGGRVGAEGAPGKGATFSFILPC